MKTAFLQAAALLLATCLSGVHAAPVHAAGEGSINLDGVENAQHAAVAIMQNRNRVDPETYNHPNRLNLSIRGSGIHLHDGFILTARHAAIEKSNGELVFPPEISVITENLEERTAKFVGANDFIDIAIYRMDVLKLDVPLTVTKFSAQEPRAGEEVYTVGYPVGWGPTLAFGKAGNTRTFLPTASSRLMQLDMGSCLGNSGGGLFNAKGEIAGMVQAIVQTVDIKSEKECSRISFAVPGPIIARVAEAIIGGGNIKFPVMGVELTTAKLGPVWRVAVDSVSGPAKQAGMLKGDIILAIGDVPVTSAAQLKSYLIENASPG
ncbi:MAG TPA: S1C family serine protease, partial [Alphaproteobacteria bacterium]